MHIQSKADDKRMASVILFPCCSYIFASNPDHHATSSQSSNVCHYPMNASPNWLYPCTMLQNQYDGIQCGLNRFSVAAEFVRIIILCQWSVLTLCPMISVHFGTLHNPYIIWI
eukprot:949910_1